MVALRKPLPWPMTVAEFLDWDPGDSSGALWQLRDGVPEMMAPATDAHGSIQGELHALLRNRLLEKGSPCRSVIAPGVVPRVRSDRNALIPDIGVTCTPPQGGRTLPDPVALIEILSPSNHVETWTNVWAYTTIPSVSEIVIVHSTRIAAEVVRRNADGSWPEQPAMIEADGVLALQSVGVSLPLREAYRTSGVSS